MKLETKDLLCAINNIKPFIPSKSVVKGGKCFLIKIWEEGNPNKGYLQVRLLKDGVNISQTIECIGVEEMGGVYLIESHIIDNCISDLSHIKTLELKKLKNGIKVKHSVGSFEIKTLPLPEIQRVENFILNLPVDYKEGSEYLEVKCSDLYKGLKNSLGARSEKDVKYTDGTIFNFDGKELHLYTTDGKKLNTSTYTSTGSNPFNFAIHGKTITSILQICPEEEIPCKIWFYKGDTLIFNFGENKPTLLIRNLTTGLIGLSSIEGVIENVEKNKESYSFCKVNTDEFSRILKRSFIYITKENLGIKVEKKGQEIIFTGELQDVGEFRDILSIERGDLKDISINISPVSLKKSLPETEKVTIGMLENYPVLLENGNIKNYVMPLRGCYYVK